MLARPSSALGKVKGEGFTACYFGDKSGPSLEFHQGPVGGVNERYFTRERMDASGKYEDLLVNVSAKTLHFTRNVFLSYTQFMAIDGDLDRAFPPQPWAQGILPLIPLERVFALTETGNKDFVRFNPEEAGDCQPLISSLMVLILRGWGYPSPRTHWHVLDFIAVAKSMGITVGASAIHDAAESLISSDILATVEGGDPNCFRFGGQWFSTFTTAAQADAMLNLLWSSWEPFCVIPKEKVHFSPGWRNLVNRE